MIHNRSKFYALFAELRKPLPVLISSHQTAIPYQNLALLDNKKVLFYAHSKGEEVCFCRWIVTAYQKKPSSVKMTALIISVVPKAGLEPARA
jgi:hypothetical protein